jgi:hypothetical protein
MGLRPPMVPTSDRRAEPPPTKRIIPGLLVERPGAEMVGASRLVGRVAGDVGARCVERPGAADHGWLFHGIISWAALMSSRECESARKGEGRQV